MNIYAVYGADGKGRGLKREKEGQWGSGMAINHSEYRDQGQRVGYRPLSNGRAQD